MSAAATASKAWIVATSVGLVEALKDQGFARWNYPIRCLHQRAKANLSNARLLSSSSSSSQPTISNRLLDTAGDNKAKQSEDSLRKVMFISCWAPN